MNFADRAWRRDSFNATSPWLFHLPEQVLEALRHSVNLVEQANAESPCTKETVPDQPLVAECTPFLRTIKRALDDSPGFVLIQGLPQAWSHQQQTIAYWLLGSMLGKPVEQNVQGTILYDVRDTGQDVRYGARFSVTNAESSFHTDNSFGRQITDYVGLLCLNPSKSGGLSQVVSAYTVYQQLSQQRPQVLKQLCQPYHVDRRGGVLPGEAPTTQYPVFDVADGELTLRYLRYWIEVGQEKANEPLTGERRAALDTIDQVVSDPELRVEFQMTAQDIMIVNNRWMFHNRTAFQDFDEPEKKRHLVRLWLEDREHRRENS